MKESDRRLTMTLVILMLTIIASPSKAWAETITLTSETGEVTLQNGDVLTGTGGENTHVTIASGATVTLSGVNITAILDYPSHQWAGITCLGDATIILADGTTNYVKGGYYTYPGIYIPADHTLTIQGNGSLEAATHERSGSGQGSGAGIGGSSSGSCGNIVIKSGKITARGSLEAAGIGGTYRGSCGNITITGGIVTAIGGKYGVGIGSGYMGSCGNITITGGIITAQGGEGAAGIGSGPYGSCGDITITLGVTSVTVTKGIYTKHSIGVSNNDGVCGTVTIGGVEGAITDSPYTLTTVSNVITLMSETGEVTLQDGDMLMGTGGKNTNVMIADGATVTLCDVNIGYGIICAGSAEITLIGTNSVTGSSLRAGIQAGGDGTMLTIKGDGSLSATGGTHCAGIGSGYNGSCGAITIEGGNITAIGGVNSAGIGSGKNGTCGTINIAGGSVTATGNTFSAGIGGGYASDATSSCGAINISGGTVTATGGNGAAGIGSGHTANGTSSGGDITITGGTVEATGGSSGAGIGCGYGHSDSGSYSTCGNITIARTVMSVTATKGRYAQHCIGRGFDYCVCGTVTIGGVVTGPISGDSFTYVRNGNLTSNIHFDKNGGWGEMTDWLFTWDGTAQAIPACTFTAPDGMIFVGWSTAADGSGTYYTDGQQVIDIGDGTLYALWRQQTESVPNGALTLYDGQTLTGKSGNFSNTHVTIADGATVTFSGVNIPHIDTDNEWAAITCEGDATIILNGENNLKGGNNSAGIFVPEGHTLTIRGDGSLTTKGYAYAAGIGGNKETPCGNIVIEGGTITATGQSNGAGIGGGESGSCGNITITGGNITATGSSSAAAIGGVESGSCGNITITGGNITATGSSSAAAIGGGESGSCGNITITDGTITATGGKYAAAIGGGRSGSCGNITITGGNITATLTSNSYSAAIGCGYALTSSKTSSCGDISITGGVTCVIATKTSDSDDVHIIGSSGNYATCGTITIDPSLMDVLSNSNKTRTLYPGITFAKEGYSTYFDSEHDATLPAGMKARIVTAKGDGQALTYETIADGDTSDKTVPASTAVMLQVNGGTSTQTIGLSLTSPSAAAISQTNLLHGSDTETTTTGSGLHYKLSYNTSGSDLGWYWGVDGGGAFTSAAHKAWLVLPSTAGTRGFFGLPGDDETTSLRKVNSEGVKSEKSGVEGWFSLDGRRLNGRPSAKGLYIHNGRKEVVR